ncbi:MAG: Cna B-type domain-containing protein [Lachnospiraceae bacterium]|nr:Cna B-type domain-containing protein [Lachnospiraceae bacterium]
MKKRKTKLWKKALVGFMSFTMFAGNLSALSVEAYASTVDGEGFVEDAEGLGDIDTEGVDTALLDGETEIVAPEVVSEEELIGEAEALAEADDTVIYTVTYYDVDGSLLGSTDFEAGTALDLPETGEGAYWLDANGIEYFAGDAVNEDLSLFVTVDDIETEETEESEDLEEEIPEDQILVNAVLVDTEGNVLDSYRVTSGMYLAAGESNDAPVIEDYEYIGAQIDASEITEVIVEETEDGILLYTVDGVELEADADIELIYESTVFDYNIDFVVTDENGDAIEGYESIEDIEFETTLDLADTQNPPLMIEGYEYIGAYAGIEEITAINIEDGEGTLETAGGAILIDSDITVTLVYAEANVSVVLTATIVDEFGDEIDEEYTEMEMPEFDADGILVLDDPELPPVEDVKVQTGLLRSVKYTYVKALIDNTVVSAIKGEESIGGLGTYYSYTTDGETWIKLKEDTTVLFEYTDGKKTTYTYEDGNVSVTATLQHANAIPDDAYFAVTPVTSGTGYDVDSYLEALNTKGETPADSEEFEYTTKNTLLYDIAFYTDDTMTEEIQPAEGMVKIDMQFLGGQLEDEIEATDNSEILVNHLSLDESTVEAAGTTANASVSAGEVKVETVSAEVSVAGESVAFATDNFSIYTITTPEASTSIVINFDSNPTFDGIYLYAYDTDSSGNYNRDTCGHALVKMDAENFDVSNGGLTWTLTSDLLTGASKAPKDLASCNVEFLMAYADASSSYSMDISPRGNGYQNDKLIKLDLENGHVGFFKVTLPAGEVDGEYVIDASLMSSGGSTDIKSVLGGAINFGVTAGTYEQHGDTQTNFATKNYAGSQGPVGGDLSNAPGEIYAGSITADSMQIRNNLSASNVYLGRSTDVAKVQDDSKNANIIVLDEATIASKVDGWIGGTSVPSGEWIPMPRTNSNKYVLDTTAFDENATIHIDLDNSTGEESNSMYDIMAGQTGGFYVNKYSGQTIVFHSNKSNVTVRKYFFCNDGSYNYSASDTPTSNGDGKNTQYLAPLAQGMIFDFTAASNVKLDGSVAGTFIAPYARAEWGTACCGWMVCNYAYGGGEWHNIYQDMPDTAVIQIQLSKLLDGADIADYAGQFNFELKDANGNVLETATNDAAGVILFSTRTYDQAGTYTYTISEVEGDINGMIYDKGVVTATVSVALNAASNAYEVTGVSYTKVETDGSVSSSDVSFHNSIENTTSIEVLKDWSDGADLHTDDTVMVQLTYKDGNVYSDVAANDSYDTTLELNSSNGWYGIFEFLPVEDESGNAIEYSVREVSVNDKEVTSSDGVSAVKVGSKTYTVSVTGTPQSGYTIVNTPNGKGSLSIGKSVNGLSSAQYQALLNNITFELYDAETNTLVDTITRADYKGKSVYTVNDIPYGIYYIVEKGTDVEGRDFSNTVYWLVSESGSTSEVVTADEPGTTGTFTFDEQMAQINLKNEYYNRPSVELKVTKAFEGWTGDYADKTFDFALTASGNNATDAANPMPENSTVSVSGTAPEASFGTITYSNEGTYYYTIRESVPENCDFVQRGGSNYYLSNDGILYTTLTVYVKVEVTRDSNGTGRVATVSYYSDSAYSDELDSASTSSGEASVNATFTNLTEESVSVSGKKTWVDENDQDGLRPESIVITLMADGVDAGFEPVTVTEANGWTWSFDNLPKYNMAGKEIAYTIEEKAVNGYEMSYSADHLSVTNTHEPEETTIKVKKVWEGDSKNTQFRQSITVELIADGNLEKPVDTKVLNADNNWQCEFTELPVKKAGTEIVYTINEVAIDKYESQITGNAKDGFTITNTYKPEYVNISGTKVWDDENNFDGSRPSSITIKLYANGELFATKTITGSTEANADSSTWAWNFDEYELEKYSGGSEIVYTVTEEQVENYSTEITQIQPDAEGHYDYSAGITITNSYTPDKTSVTVNKTWLDNNDQDGKRPKSIEVQLIKTVGTSESVYDTQTLNEANGWTYTWSGLATKQNNQPVVYSVHEVGEDTATHKTAEGYAVSYNGTDITNTYKPEVISVSGIKTWVDDNDRDGLRKNVTIGIYDGETRISAVEASETNDWKWSFSNLPKYKKGVLINYTVKEETELTGYSVEPTNRTITVPVTKETTAVEGLVFTNTHTPYPVIVEGSKIWDDSDDQDGLRPASITVQLYANNKPVEGKSAVVSVGDDGKWEFAFYDLPKKEGGQNIVYTIEEVSVPSGYSVSYVQPDVENNEYTCSLTNKHTPELVDISGSKTWVDNEDQDGLRPKSITVKLLANGEVYKTKPVTADESGNWNYSFNNLPKKAGGTVINYTVTEEVVEGYSTTVNGYNITNTHEPEKISIEGSKVWVDGNDQDGKRPENVTVVLYANNTEVARTTTDDQLNWRFDDLNKYEKNGQKIVYTVKELPVEGYTTEPADGYQATSADGEDNLTGLVFTNTHTPEKTQISVNKVWYDDDNRDNKRPASITVNLLSNGNKVDSVTLNAGNNWSHTFKDLPKYADRKEIVYSVSEETIDGYTASYASADGVTTITNSYTPGETYVSGNKVWSDENNQDGTRPESITVNLYADGEYVRSTTVTAADGWEWSFTGLPEYKTGQVGQRIVYTVTETAIDGYTTVIAAVEGKDNEFTITNEHKPETISISGSKVWDDNGNQDGIRPGTITVKLTATNVEGIEHTATATAPGYEWSFTDLPRFRDGVEIKYVVSEGAVEGYKLTDQTQGAVNPETGNITGIVFTNTHTPSAVSISGSKTWDDNKNQDGIRPDSIQVQLYANGIAQGQAKTVSAGDDGSWNWAFENLPRYNGGVEISYTVQEILPENSGYELTSTDAGDRDESTGNISNIVFTNKHTPETLKISGSKTWEDANDQDGIRPDSLTIILYKNVNGSKEKVSEATATPDSNWTWTFEELPKKENGKLIQYSVEEVQANKYTGAMTSAGTADSDGNVTGVVFTNVYTPETTSVSGTKVWDDNHDQDGARPQSITLNLYKNGSKTIYKTMTLTPDDKSADSWNWSFEDLPKYENGKLITYRVEEVAVTGYEEPVYSDNGKTITNKRTPETTNIGVVKVWSDSDNQDGKRPESVTVRLLADGVEIKSQTLDGSNDWKYTFTDLPKYSNGKAISYTVTEDSVTDYSTVIAGSMESANPYFTITNSYTPGKVSVSGTKTWVDNDNQDGLRPNAIIVRLYAGEEEVDSTPAYAQNGYSWSFKDLDEYISGQKIEYSVKEDAVNGYTTEITSTGTNIWSIVNTHETEKVDISGTKTWDDSNNQDGVRPDSINVNLLANGTIVRSATVKADGEEKWSYAFTGLDKFANGSEIKYTITEDPITVKEGHNGQYETTINGYDITNTYIPEKVNISGEKTWDDSNDQDGVRPSSITVYLKANGSISQTLEVPVALDGSASWSFNNLPKYKDGVEIEYTIDEAPVQNDGGVLLYEKSVNGYNITNTHKPETVTVSGQKVWNDNDNNDNLRPSSIEIQLLANGNPVEGKKLTVTSDDLWKWEFTGLPKYEGGKLIVYSVSELSIDEYTTTVTGEGTYEQTVTNTHEPEYVGLTLNKKWYGNNAAATAKSVQVNVEGRISDGSPVVPARTATISAPAWTYVVRAEDKALPKYYKGEVIKYYVTEIIPDGAAYIQVDAQGAEVTNAVLATGDDELTADIYNLGLTKLTVIKKWENDPGYFGGNGYVDVALYADGTLYKTVQVKAADNWEYTFNDLPIYSTNGNKIVYTVEETSQLSEYNTSNNGKPVVDYSQNGYIIIKNVLDPLSLTVNKQWLGDPEGTTHSDITVNILSSVELKGTATSVFDRIRKVLGADSDKWYQYETVTLGNSNNWTTTVNDLPRYAKVGNEIVKVSYAVQEVNVPEGYTSVANVDGSTATIINTGYTSVAGFKTWDDGSNVVGYRPGSAEFAAVIALYQDGKQYLTGADTAHFRWLDTAGDTWNFEFYDLPSGHTYTIGELGRVLGYGEPTIDGYTIKNPLEFTQMSVTKVWDDQDNVYASRPASIAFRLLANGTQANIAGVTSIVTLDNTNGASYTWKNLPVNDKSGNKITYSVEEVSVPSGYTASVSVDGTNTTITNTYRPEETELTVYKVWDDNNDSAKIRPASIQVALTRNGSDVEMVTLSAANGWSHTWTGLSTVLSDGSGQRAEYGVREVSQILGYTVTVTGSGTAYTITNYYREPSNPPRTPGEPPEEEPPTEPDVPTQPPYTIPDEPTPLAGLSQVLGARRAPNGSVLGARRSPQTGDASNAAAFAAAMASAGAMMGAWFAMRKKKKG